MMSKMYFKAPTTGFITSFMGPGRNHPVIGSIRAHQGIDIGTGPDDSIYAAASGVAYNVGVSNDVGNFILIQHPNGMCTSYSHMRNVTIRQGARVSQGQKIGNKGATGRLVTGKHLHFEISKGRWDNNLSNKVNPLLYFTDETTHSIQVILERLGYDVKPDGIYGEQTITAVALYQKRNNLTVDGKAGRGTYAMLLKEKRTPEPVVVAGVTTVKPKGEIYMELNKRQTEDLAMIYKNARSKGLFKSKTHEEEVMGGVMTQSKAIYLNALIANAALNYKG